MKPTFSINSISYLKASFLIAAAAILIATIYLRLSQQPLTPLKTQPIAPGFVLQDIQGKLHALSDYRGKVIVVNFWASWCPPCSAEMPSMQRAADLLAQQEIHLIGIGVGETNKSVQNFLQRVQVRFPLLLDTDSKVTAAWSVQTLPTTFVIDQQGHIIFMEVGQRRWDAPSVLEQIRTLKKAG
ncbi:MAG: TlpA disulfide reductase family protein [Gammaproteobacteria bacterium]|jgi:peroxiredoxin